MSTQGQQFEPVAPPMSPEELFKQGRKLGIGGSDVHHLFPSLDLNDKDDPGSRYGCPRRLSYEKLDVKPDYEHTPETLRIFERGHILEEYAADKYEEKTGRRVFRKNTPYVSETLPFMRCNIDRRIKADENGIGCLECKSANEHVFFKMQQEGLPTAYQLQLQHSMFVMDVKWGAFAVIEAPDFMDSVIEQIEDSRLRRKVIDSLAPKFQFFSFEVKRDEQLIESIVEREQKFWNLIENGKLADPLPDLGDERCKSCPFRKSCRGLAYAEANAKVPVRDTKGVVYTPIESVPFIEASVARLQLMKEIEEREEKLAALNNELKQNFPADVDAVEIPGTGVKVRWSWKRGAVRWDADGLKADAKTIGRKLHFADWAKENAPGLFKTFEAEVKESPSIAERYQVQSAPSKSFTFTVKGA